MLGDRRGCQNSGSRLSATRKAAVRQIFGLNSVNRVEGKRFRFSAASCSKLRRPPKFEDLPDRMGEFANRNIIQPRTCPSLLARDSVHTKFSPPPGPVGWGKCIVPEIPVWAVSLPSRSFLLRWRKTSNFAADLSKRQDLSRSFHIPIFARFTTSVITTALSSWYSSI